MRLLLFLQQSHLLCWGFASLVHLVLQCSMFYIFTLFCIYIIFQQYFFAAVCSGGSSLIIYQLHCQALFCCLNCSALQFILQCNVLQCVTVQFTVISLKFISTFDFLVLLWPQFIEYTCFKYLNYLLNTFNLHCTLYELAFGWWKRHLVQYVGVISH